MLSLFTRRVALSTHCSTATYTRLLPSSASTLRYRGTLENGLHTSTARLVANPRCNVNAGAGATTKGAKSSTKPTTVGRKKPGKELTPGRKAELLQAKKESDKKKKEKAAALRAKLKAQAKKKEAADLRAKLEAQAKKKEAAALQRKRLADKKKQTAQKKKEREEAKKPKIIKPPPRRMPALSLFVQESGTPIREVSAAWANLSEERKRDYSVRASEMTEKRREEFNAFLKTVTPLDILRYNRHQRGRGRCPIRVKSKDSGRRPSNAYMRYLQEFRMQPDQAGKPAVAVVISAGEAWRSMSQEEKDKYKAAPSESTTA